MLSLIGGESESLSLVFAVASKQVYEIRRSGQVLCRSTVADCGYPQHIIKDMAKAGLSLYCDGKKIKSRPGCSRTGCGSAGV